MSSLKSEEYVDAMAAISLTSSYRRTVQHEGSETETHVPSTINQRLADAEAASLSSLSAEIRTLSMHFQRPHHENTGACRRGPKEVGRKIREDVWATSIANRKVVLHVAKILFGTPNF